MNETVRSELSRDLGLFHIMMMGVGMMIGAGVFVATGIAIGVSGSGGILITFALNGLLAFFSTMTYAELASAIPEAGGGYTYVREAFGGITGFMSGWMSWFGHAVAGSLYAITFATYGVHFLKDYIMFSNFNINTIILEKIIAVIIAIIFVYINYRGASETGTASIFISIGQTVVLGIIGVAGIYVAFAYPERLNNFSNFLPHGWGKILVTMGFTYIGFEGYEVIAQAGEETIEPKKNIPKAIFYSLIIVVTTYLLVAFAVVIGAKPGDMSVWQYFQLHGATGFAEGIKNLLPFGGLLVVIAALFSSTSALNATTYSSTRVSFAMGRDGYLPEVLAKISKKEKVPHIALLCSAVIIIVIAAALPVEDVAAGADIMFLLLFLFVNLAVIKIRREKGDVLNYGYIMPYFPFIPITSIVVQLVLSIWLFDMSVTAWISSGLWIIAGLIIYFSYCRTKSSDSTEDTVIAKESELGKCNKQILVPVANPERAEILADYAMKIAEYKDTEITVMNVITVPDQTPLNEAEQFVEEKRELLNNVRNRISSVQPVNTVLRYGHDVLRSIVSSVEERNCELVVLGWEGYSRWDHFTLGSNLDRIVERVTKDQVIIKPGKSKVNAEIKKILLPTAGGPHGKFAAKMAKILSSVYGADVTVLHVNLMNRSENDIRKMLSSVINQFEDKVKLEISNSQGVSNSILENGSDHDLIIMGATNEGAFQQLLFGSIPKRVASEYDKTLMITKKGFGWRSWLKYWLGRR